MVEQLSHRLYPPALLWILQSVPLLPPLLLRVLRALLPPVLLSPGLHTLAALLGLIFSQVGAARLICEPGGSSRRPLR